MKHLQSSVVQCVFALLVGSAWPCAADGSPVGTMKIQQATAGNESVATAGFDTAQQKVAEAQVNDATELKLSAGGLFATGNARSSAVTGSSRLRVRREANQFSLAVAGNYARAATALDASTRVTVENIQGKARYDRFLVKHLAIFTSLSALRDRFQGLDLRVNLDPGLAYYVVDEAKEQLWTELGYDLQYDFRRDANIAEALAAGKPLEKAEVRHSGRVFVGYVNSLNKVATVDTGIEYLQAFSQTENWRLNWTIGLNTAIAGNFSIATTFALKYDHNPLLGVKTTDSITSVSLVYQLL